MDSLGKHKTHGRKDHYVPQGYLRGFIDPARAILGKPLWYFDLTTRSWSEKSTTEIGWERGFYDYAGPHIDAEHPDVTFAKFEREFPIVCEEMPRRSYKGWVKHRPFLLGYIQMMRARSPLFVQQQAEQNRHLRGATVTAVDGNRITVDSPELRPLPELLIRNRTISNIREEIKKGPDWMWDWNWCLRYTESVLEPFVTGRQPLVLEHLASIHVEEAMAHPDTFIWFPLSWRACLIGSRSRFIKGTDVAHPALLRHVREMFARASEGYVISPCKIDPLI